MRKKRKHPKGVYINIDPQGVTWLSKESQVKIGTVSYGPVPRGMAPWVPNAMFDFLCDDDDDD